MIAIVLVFGLIGQKAPDDELDPIPTPVLKYFEARDAIANSQRKAINDKLKSIEVALKGSVGTERASLTRQQTQLQSVLGKIKTAEIHPFLSLQNKELETIGHLSGTIVDRIIDDNTFVAYCARDAMILIVHDFPTDKLRKQQEIDNDEFFRLRSFEGSRETLERADIPQGSNLKRGNDRIRHIWEVSRIRRQDVMKWQKQYESEKKDDSNVPANANEKR